MYLIRIQFAQLDKLLNFRDNVVRRGHHHRVVISGGLAKHQIAPAVALPRFHKSEVAAQGAFQQVRTPIKNAHRFSLGDHGAKSGGSEKRRNSRAARAQALGQRALRIQLHFKFPGQNQFLEQFVFAHVGGDHLLHLTRLQQQSDAEVVQSGVVADDREIFGTRALHRGDQVFRNAAETETAHQYGCAVPQIFNGLGGIGYALVHEFPWGMMP